ncbi:MAG: ribosome maturation factor RimP [Candidatus Eutrophobiaceae bacterium]
MKGQDPKLIQVLQPVVVAFNYELLGMELLSGNKILRLYIDSEQGVSMDDCAKLTEQAFAVLEAERLIHDGWGLEVSSPGVDRILFTSEQMVRWIGHEVRIWLVRKWQERRRLDGRLLTADAKCVRVEQDGESFDVPCHVIERIRLRPIWGTESKKKR